MSLYRFAQLLELKYLTKKAIDAENLRSKIVEHIQQMLANAAGRSGLGIMNFPKMVADDKIQLTIDLTKNGKNITKVTVSSKYPELINKYKPLESQVKNYLEKYWELFPTKSDDETVDYDNFSFQLNYGEDTRDNSGIASY